MVLETRGDQDLRGVARLASGQLGGVDGGTGGLVELDPDHHPGKHHHIGEEQHRKLDRVRHEPFNALPGRGVPAFANGEPGNYGAMRR
ncbi:hypothetical protein NSI01_01470 [Pimelobacter simplex]|nr:hypothetical protein NSI01_01470 [Pimelobacter simplex]